MASTAAELAGATSADIASARNALIEYLQERWPTLAIRGGPLSDLVLGPASDALAAIDVRAESAEASMDPETALSTGVYDEDILASVLAGRGVTRQAAASASGSMAIRFNNSTTRTVPARTVFEAADGTEFYTSTATRLLAPGSTAVLTGDYVLVEEPSGGTFIGVVPITASAAGLSGNRVASTSFTPAVDNSSIEAAWASTDIAGGLDAETDAELLERLPSATAPRTAASLAGAEALIRDAVPAISDVSTIKFGDDAMLRGRSVLSLQTPGRFDLRYRTEAAPSRERSSVTATYIGLVGPYGAWRFTVDRDTSPGRFRVEKVLQTDDALTATGYAPTTAVPGFNLADIDEPPDIRSVADATMSRYATAIVTFTDPDTDPDDFTVDVSTRDYDVVCRLIPSIETAQDAVDADDARAAGGDCLVRGIVPAMVSVTAEATPAQGVTLTAAEVRTAVAQAINSIAGVSTRLLTARVAAEAATILPRGTALLLTGWAATIYPNDGGAYVYATDDGLGLIVAEDLDRNISSATLGYCCDPESVTASVST